MGNMSYCRYRNTLMALEDCDQVLDDTEDLSEGEIKARLRLIKLCMRIAEDFSDEVKV